MTTKHVLVVEDDEGTRALLLQALREEGFDPIGAPDGSAALTLLQAEEAAGRPPALVLLDMHMPVMDGASFARAYRARTPHPAPILLLTAGRPTADQIADIGAASFVAKPFDLDTLFGSVRRSVDARHGLHILLIEDSPADARLVVEALADTPGVHVEVAPDGESGLRALDRAAVNAHPFNLVLLDLNLPQLSGFQVLETIKRDDARRRVPVVVITGWEDGEHVSRAYELRANGYVVKSPDWETMRERIRGTIRFWQLVRLPPTRGTAALTS